jgi:hypothetical protein
MSLDIKVLAFTRMAYTWPCLVKRMTVPSGVHVSPSSSQDLIAAKSRSPILRLVSMLARSSPGILSMVSGGAVA